jgi:hypothetical protein
VPDKVLIDTNLENWEAFLSSNWVKRKTFFSFGDKYQKQLMFHKLNPIWFGMKSS